MITNVPAFAQLTKTNQAVLTAACVLGAANAPTNTVLVATAGPDGGMLTSVSITPRSSVVAGTAYVFTSPDAGVNQYLIGAVQISLQTITTTSGISNIVFNFTESTSRRMAPNERIYIGSTSVAASGSAGDAQWSDF